MLFGSASLLILFFALYTPERCDAEKPKIMMLPCAVFRLLRMRRASVEIVDWEKEVARCVLCVPPNNTGERDQNSDNFYYYTTLHTT